MKVLIALLFIFSVTLAQKHYRVQPPEGVPGPQEPTLEELLDECIQATVDQTEENVRLEIEQQACFSERDQCKEDYMSALNSLSDVESNLTLCRAELQTLGCSGKRDFIKIKSSLKDIPLEDSTLNKVKSKRNGGLTDSVAASLEVCRNRLRRLKQIKGGLNQTTLECREKIIMLRRQTSVLLMQIEAYTQAAGECYEAFFECDGRFPGQSRSPSPSVTRSPTPSVTPGLTPTASPQVFGNCPQQAINTWNIVFNRRSNVTQNFADGTLSNGDTCSEFLVRDNTLSNSVCIFTPPPFGVANITGIRDETVTGITSSLQTLCLSTANPPSTIVHQLLVGCFGFIESCELITYEVSV